MTKQQNFADSSWNHIYEQQINSDIDNKLFYIKKMIFQKDKYVKNAEASNSIHITLMLVNLIILTVTYLINW